MGDLRYLTGYPEHLIDGARTLLAQGRLQATLARRYPDAHEVRNDRALLDYANELKTRYLKTAPPLAKVLYDNRLQVVQKALGTHTTVSRVQGTQLKAKRELRVAAVFKDAPAAFLRMIVVHELAHLKVREHDRSFYALCQHMEPDYHQLEFDTRLWLTARDHEGSVTQQVQSGEGDGQ